MHRSSTQAGHSGRWKPRVAGIVAFVLVGGGLVLSAPSVYAASCPVTTQGSNCSSNETETLTVTAGTMDITVPASVNLGSVPVGQTTTAVNLGQITWTDTLGGTTPAITLATTDLCQNQASPPTCSTSNDIPASHITVSMTSSAITAQNDSTCLSANNAGGSWTNGTGSSAWSIATDTTPGTTLSSTFTLATAATGTDGCYGYASAASPTIKVAVPANAAVEPYQGTLTYTITD